MSIEVEIRRIIGEAVEGFDPDKLGRDVAFEDAALDSLDMATVFLEVQEHFGVEIPEGSEEDYDTLGKLAAFIEINKNA